MPLDIGGPTMPLSPEQEMRFRIDAWEARIAALEAETAALKAYVRAMFGGERPRLGSLFTFRRNFEDMETAQRIWDGLFGGDMPPADGGGEGGG